MSKVELVVGQTNATPPTWLKDNLVYETIMGSVAYGVSRDMSDTDIYGICIPPKDWIFPHLRGEIPGFGIKGPTFDQWQQHHIEYNTVSYDFSIYGIVRYFQLLMENNPNIIDSIFTPDNCVTHCNGIGRYIRDNRKLFLHKGSWHKFKGYAYSQVSKIKSKTPQEGSKRAADVEKHGYDVKFAYHVVRLLDEVEQILTLGDINLQRDNERLKAIRAGEWTEEQVIDFFKSKEVALEATYQASTLQHSPDEAKIKELLLNCLESHFGSIDEAVSTPTKERELLLSIQRALASYK